MASLIDADNKSICGILQIKNNYSDNDEIAFYFNHIHKIIYNKLMMELFN